jgi:opacity protein-like surface antigen
MRGKTFSGCVLAALAASSALAQAPATPPPSPGRGEADAGAHELLPDIGRIGAQVVAFVGPSSNPYETGTGVEGGGYLTLPLRRAPGGKLSYEIFLGVTLAEGEPFAVADPLPRTVRTRLRALHVSPFALRYTLRGSRLRPFVTAGVDVLAAFTRQEPGRTAPELAERGLAEGQAALEVGGHAGGGVEVVLGGGLSLNLEYRFTATEERSRLHTSGVGLGIHF